jgi:subfamily B ATP-binding cassette protein MsbA
MSLVIYRIGELTNKTKGILLKIMGISHDEMSAVIWLLKSYIWIYRAQFFLIWVLGLGIVWSSGLVVFMVKPALQSSFDGASTSTSLWIISIVIMLASLAGGLFQYAQTFLYEKTGLKIVASLRRDLYNHLLHMDVSYLSRNHVGELSAICMEETGLVRDVTGTVFVNIVQDLLLFLALIGIIVYRDWQLSLLALISVPLIVLGKGRVSLLRRSLTEELLASRARISAWVSEVLFNSRLVKIFGAEDRETNRMHRVFEQHADLHLRSLRARSVSQPINELIIGATIVMVMMIGSWRTGTSQISLAELTAILVALLAAYRPLKRLDNIGNRLQEGASAAVRIKKILDMQPTVNDRENALPIVIANGAVELKDVCFGYGRGSCTLKNINLKIPAGSLFAIVGPSGAGKTSLLNLIPRFFDPSSGEILIDGQDISSFTQSSLRSQMAMVTQETLLFDESIASNIAYGKPDATREEIVCSAKLAGAHDFIQKFTEGYDTMIGARGVRLSGGERQRISIARALMRNAKILIFDEATSSLDNKSERTVKQSISAMENLPTRIVVAHRLSTIRGADHIVVMFEGGVIEEGKHDDLLANNGLYAELYAAEERERQAASE